MTIAAGIRTARAARGMTQEALAAAICVGRNVVAQWETDRADPQTATLPVLARALGVSINALFPPATPPETPPMTTFAIRNLSVLAYAQGFTLWHYKAGAGTLASAAAPGFFNAAADMLAAGDMVMVSAADGATILTIAATGQTVAVAALAGAAPREAERLAA